MLDFGALPAGTATVLRVVLIAIAAIVAFVAYRAAVRVAARELLERRSAEADAEAMPPIELERRVATLRNLAIRTGGVVLAVVAALMVLSAFGVEIGPAIAGLGVVGIAVGFGAQTLVKDWLAGIFVVLENQYSQGDVVRIAGVDGVVEEFSLRRTTLRDLSGTLHTVPNGQITVASNMTRLWARVNLDVSVAYDTDIDRATEIINRVGRELHRDPEWSAKLIEPPQVVRVDALADSAVTLKVLGQVRPAQQWAVTGELRKRILAAFGKEGVEIPFPHQVIVTRGGGGDPRVEAAAAGERSAGPEGAAEG